MFFSPEARRSWLRKALDGILVAARESLGRATAVTDKRKWKRQTAAESGARNEMSNYLKSLLLVALLPAVVIAVIGQSPAATAPPVPVIISRTLISLSNPVVPLPTNGPVVLGSVQVPAGALNRVGQTFDVWLNVAQGLGWVEGQATLQLVVCDTVNCTGDTVQLLALTVILPDYSCFGSWFCWGNGNEPAFDLNGSFAVTQSGKDGILIGSGSAMSNPMNNGLRHPYGTPAYSGTNLTRQPVDLTHVLYLALLMDATAWQSGREPVLPDAGSPGEFLALDSLHLTYSTSWKSVMPLSLHLILVGD